MSVQGEIAPSTPDLWRQTLSTSERFWLKALSEKPYSKWTKPTINASNAPILQQLMAHKLIDREKRGGFWHYRITFLGRRVFQMVGFEPA